MYSSTTCYVWLNFFYYIQIVPANRALSIWVKRNIRSFIYVALLLDGTLFLFNSVMNIPDVFSGFTCINGTGYAHRPDEVYFSSQVCFFIINVHILICLCIMTVSSFSTAHYLFRHMRNVAQSGSCFYTPRIQRQMRVTITGISQGVFYFLYDTFHLLDSFAYMFAPDFYFSYSVSFTVTSLFISGNTINLGIGQFIFRQRVAAVWRALKALCIVAIVTDNIKLHSGQVTSGEIANTLTVNGQMRL
ncbi:taste receptor type 2 member 8-like [Seriola aureovittata]|uniref:taste receptor type 2 member 8-like n=1 Tax=Seriola aureovittata TaxID=2871759 RepID=UPI0024BD7EF8|nr:taste receptor type 2 member 8-like [Seriola aureovittata]